MTTIEEKHGAVCCVQNKACARAQALLARVEEAERREQAARAMNGDWALTAKENLDAADALRAEIRKLAHVHRVRSLECVELREEVRRLRRENAVRREQIRALGAQCGAGEDE